jgi:hypothetical protein
MNNSNEIQSKKLKYFGIVLLSFFINIPMFLMTISFGLSESPMVFLPTLIYLIIGLIIGWRKPKEKAINITIAFTALLFVTCLILSLTAYLNSMNNISDFLVIIVFIVYFAAMWVGIKIGNIISNKSNENNTN